MAVYKQFRISGDPDELRAAYIRSGEVMGDEAPPGLRSHVAAAAADGLVVAEVWESAEQAEAFHGSDEFRQALAQVGLPSPDEAQIETLEVLNELHA